MTSRLDHSSKFYGLISSLSVGRGEPRVLRRMTSWNGVCVLGEQGTDGLLSFLGTVSRMPSS